jgi:hypothetical protein
MNHVIEWKKTQPGSTEAVQFSDGMLVTAEDLSAAMRYPLSVIQVLLKAYFGCGIVCGLGLSKPAEPQPADSPGGTTDAAGRPVPQPQPTSPPNYVLTVEKGVALGCDGYPIELCGPLQLDLTPDPCRLDRGTKRMFVAARRVTAAEAAARPCGCAATGGESGQQCSRMRDHVLVQAFDEEHLPPEICRMPDPPAKDATGKPREDPPQGIKAICECMKQCGACACCGEPWVLLGSVPVGVQGLGAIDLADRRYVKPIACVCAAVQPEPAQQPNRPDPKAATGTSDPKAQPRTTEKSTPVEQPKRVDAAAQTEAAEKTVPAPPIEDHPALPQ